jgi:5'-3' exonuclease
MNLSSIGVIYIHMAGSSRTTFAKRQKERARQEKRQEKAQRKAERKQSGDTDAVTPETQPIADLVVTHDEDGQPQGFDFHDFGK